MRKIVIGMALASTAIATPALARDDSWYVELDFGPMVVEDSKFDIGTINNAAILDSDYGVDGGAAVGYDFGIFRLEAEASYRTADHESIRTVAGGTLPVGANALSGTFRSPDGESSALSFMGNLLLDFGEDNGLQAFVGGGAGISRVKYDIGSFIDSSDSRFAWQLLAGFRAPLTDSLDVGVKYRFHQVDDLQFVDAAGRDVETRWRSHSAMGSIIYNFGGAVAAPPPPPPPPPPQVVCNKGPYIVFFEWDKSDITPEASSILDSAVSAYANCDNVPIMLAGHADRSGSASYNVGLSTRRNASVRSYLGARGIPDAAISSQAFGESQNRVPTADGVRELQNRRVEITYGPGSGM